MFYAATKYNVSGRNAKCSGIINSMELFQSTYEDKLNWEDNEEKNRQMENPAYAKESVNGNDKKGDDHDENLNCIYDGKFSNIGEINETSM